MHWNKDMDITTDPEQVYEVIGKLKALKRRGWIQRGCRQTESDAEHSWGVAFLVMMYTPFDLNKLKCLQMALIHDLCEIYAGDVTPHDAISPHEKTEKETAAVSRLAQDLSQETLKDLYLEFEEGKTPEAVFVKDLDKLDMVIQCRFFIDQGYLPKEAWNEFVPYSQKRIRTPLVQELLNRISQGYFK